MALRVLNVSGPVLLTFVAKASGSYLEHDKVYPDVIHGLQSFHIVLIAELILHKHGVQSVRHCRYLLKGQLKFSLNNGVHAGTEILMRLKNF
jgi:hypothetical protein